MYNPEPQQTKLLSWRDVFPAYTDPSEIDPRLIVLVDLCGQTGLPFPVEPNRATWWTTLFQIGQWAVKPPWYTAFALWLRGDITVRQGRLLIPAGTIPGVENAVDIPQFQMYEAREDRVPDIGLTNDPTPGGNEALVWALLMLRHFGWSHPFDTTPIESGHAAWRWCDKQRQNLHTAQLMAYWAIDPLRGRFRALDDGFTLPYPVPATDSELMLSLEAIYECYHHGKFTSGERAAWIWFCMAPHRAKHFAK